MKFLTIIFCFVFIGELFSIKANTSVFIKNQGQIASIETNQPLKEVLYYISTPNAKLYLTTKGLIYFFQKNQINIDETEIPIAKQTEWQRVDVEFKNANFSNVIENEPVAWHYNFFYAHCPQGIMNVPAFRELYVKNIYKGIDLKFYIQDDKLKYDFIVYPYADYKQIQMEYKYVDYPYIDPSGDAIINTLYGKIIESKPVCIQGNKIIENTSWISNGNILQFNVPYYDKSQFLVIDPFLIWSTYFGGNSDEASESIAINQNMIIIAGNTSSSNLPTYNPGSGAYFSGSNTGLTDIFIAAFNLDHSIRWVTYYGGTKDDVKGKPIIANDTYIYVSGQSNSTDIPTLNPGGGAFYQATLNNTGTYDGFLIKFSIFGQLLWATYLGGSDQDELSFLANNNNSLYAYVLTYSSDMPLVNPGGGAWQQGATNNNEHIYLARFDLNSNAMLWGTYFGQSTTGMGYSWNTITCNNTHLYGAFNTKDINSPTLSLSGAYNDNTYNGGTSDLLICRFTANGVLEWATYFGGNGYEEQRGISISNNRLWVSGTTASNANFPLVDPGNGAYFQNTYGGGAADGFIASFSLNGQLLWSTYYGGNQHDYIRDIKGDNYGIFIAGRITGGNFPLYNPGTPTFYESSSRSTFIAKFKQNGIRQWSTYFSGSAGDIRKLAVTNDAVYLTGFVNNSLLTQDPGNGAYFDNTFNGGTWDAFIAKFDKCVIPTVQVTASQNAICKYDSTWLYATGGINYLWSTLQTTDSIHVAPLSTTSYSVTVTDDMTCTNTGNINITVYPLPDVNILGAHPICFNDSITISAVGAQTYQWLPGMQTTSSITVTPANTTTYYVIGTDQNSCSNIDSVQIIVHPLPLVTISGEHPICLNDSIWLYGNGATSYVWSTMAATDSIQVSPLQTTIFYVTGTDNNGCKNKDSAEVVVYPLPNVQITGNHPICFGDSLTLYANGAHTYFWTPGNYNTDSIIVSPSQTTTFYVLGTDTNMCKNIDSTTVTVFDLPNVQIQGDHPICFGDSITLAATGAVSYVWYPGALTGNQQIFSPLQTTTYVVVGTDHNQCVNSDTVSITVYQLPNVQIQGDHPICFGDSITLTATGAVSYVWYPGTLTGNQQTFQPNSTQQYIVIGTDINQCKNSDSVTIVVYPLPNVQITGNHPICFGDSITLQAINAQTYVWNTGVNQSSITVAPLQSTTYMVTGTDTNGCMNADTAFVIVNPLPLVRINGVHPICLYDSISLSAAGAVLYTWQPWGYQSSAIQVSPQQTTQIILTGTDANGCVNSDTATLVVYALPIVSVSGANPICFGDSVTVTANGAQNYIWMPGNLTGNNQVLSPQQTTTYIVTGIDTNQCKNTTQFDIIVYELPVANINGISRICQMEEVTLTATGGTSYLWNTQQTDSSINVAPMTTTTYSVIAFKNICSDTAYFTIIVDEKPTLTITNDTTIIIGMNVPLNVSGAQTYSWTPIQYLSCVTCANPIAKPSDNIEYCVVGTTAQGCSDTVCVQITVDKECGEVFIPSGFSPNNDGNNDVLFVRGKCIKKMQFYVYNRWGEKVFESNDPDIGWDGTFRGKAMDSGVFVYQLRAEYYNGVVVNKQGNVTLIR
ncbi:MAG: gliding motility-associated C-terminal domain-containing protein [Bacteroidales bacterium]|nr:gliding motility-associated C-terminal domain-containing protein [Bacteroidales bacterium]